MVPWHMGVNVDVKDELVGNDEAEVDVAAAVDWSCGDCVVVDVGAGDVDGFIRRAAGRRTAGTLGETRVEILAANRIEKEFVRGVRVGRS